MTQLKFKEGAFFLQIEISGLKSDSFQGLLDTGSETTHLTNEDCLRLGLQIVGAQEVTCIHGDRKKIPLYEGSVKVGEKQHMGTLVRGLLHPITYKGKRVISVVGQNVLRHHVATLNWPQQSGELT